MTDQPAPLPGFATQVLASVARHAMSAVAGALIGYGAISQDQGTQLTSIGVSIILWSAAQGWSYMQKRNAHAALVSATTPAAPPQAPTSG